ncbi:aminotransferase DegT [Roseomonas hellenica]|uniref:Aminotransferase DegT n=1 Tax=Plastoroseomonas hellenica TaxID=2687306 RepID=A0ABS5F352_9PROT|nr:DegT/DnrJ/EryC1/StrS family aminotransferase [Plastoroseomonas hellenica]MBR0666977.1 aminotransferase DegT [Plastoroseomonas hellenica]
MPDDLHTPERDVVSHLPFHATAKDSLWAGLERALDNRTGILFITDDAGILLGQVTLDAMRAAIQKGAHLHAITLGELAASTDTVSSLEPVLDPSGRLTGVVERGDRRGLAIAEPNLSHSEFRNLLDAFLSTWISSGGEYLRSFEERFANRCGAAYGVATSNGTVSLHLAMATLGIGEGDEVIVPDLTFAACANTVMQLGARPVLVDIDPVTWCLSPDTVERAITPRTRAIMPVHLFGRPAPMTEIRALADAHGLFLIEDCAEAPGARYDGRPIGAFSDIASCSFFANKIITTGEGGICVTNDPDMAQRLRMLRDHGMRPERRYWFEEAGFNYRMTNLQASIGCAQLDRMDALIGERREIHQRYVAILQNIPGVGFPPAMDTRSEPVIWFSCVTVPSEARPAIIKACAERRIDLRPFVNSLSSMPAYRRFARKCPISGHVSRTGLHLPTSRMPDARLLASMEAAFRSVLA